MTEIESLILKSDFTNFQLSLILVCTLLSLRYLEEFFSADDQEVWHGGKNVFETYLVVNVAL